MLGIKTTLHNLDFRNFESGIWSAAGIRTCITTGSAVASTFISLYLYQERQLSMTMVGLITLIAGLLSGVFQFAGGVLADKYGHRMMLIIYIVCGIFVQAVLAVTVGFNSAIILIAVLITLRQIVNGITSPIIAAIVADFARSERMAKSYALMQISDNVGWAIGPVLGGLLLGSTSYIWMFWVSTAIYSVSLLISLLALKEGNRHYSSGKLTISSLKGVSTNYPLLILGILSILVFLNISQWLSTLSVFTIDRLGFSEEQFGLLITISGIIIIVFQFPIAAYIEKIGIGKSLFLGGFLHGAGFLLFTWITGFTPAIAAVAIIVTGEMFFLPTIMAVIGKISRPEDRAKNMGFFGLFSAFGSSMGPLLGGYLMDTFPDRPLFLWGPIALAAFMASFGFVWWARRFVPFSSQLS